jgi:hypothetical protein
MQEYCRCKMRMSGLSKIDTNAGMQVFARLAVNPEPNTAVGCNIVTCAVACKITIRLAQVENRKTTRGNKDNQ